ncbi:MAG: HPr kinase/phosphorylase [Verrucomicrobiota bacterium]|jgi:HPr kinase/phosphorylase
MTSPVKHPTITVGEFFTRHSEALQLKPLTETGVGFGRTILEPTINRPGLALCGFFAYFADKRIQVLGSAELAYLNSITVEEVSRRVAELCSHPIPCIVVARELQVPPALLEAARMHEIAVFLSPMVTMRFINAATLALEFDFAPRKSEYGSMVDIQGMGVLIRGSSGIGKSEVGLGLIERGCSLVADDITHFRVLDGRELMGTASELGRGHMEIRGLGVINVTAVFGVSALRIEKRLDLVVTLKDWQEIESIDRTGLEQEYYEILGFYIPHVTIPVRPGRDLARLVEVAAMDQKLKSLGYNSAVEFNDRLMSAMQKKKDR